MTRGDLLILTTCARNQLFSTRNAAKKDIGNHRQLGWVIPEGKVTCGNCRFDIRRAPIRYVPADHLSSARKLYTFMLRSGPPFQNCFRGLHDITLCHAMEFLAFFVNRHLRPGCQNAAAGLEELYSWPDSFDEIVLEEADLLKQRIGGKRYRYAKLVETIERTSDAQLRHILVARAEMILQAPDLCALADQERRSRRPRKSGQTIFSMKTRNQACSVWIQSA